MIRSMTGYGACEIKNDEYVVRAFIRATNNKSLKITSRLPDQLSSCEGDVEKAVRDQIERGTIYLVLEHEMIRPQAEYEFNLDAIKAYHAALTSIQKELGVTSGIDLATIIPLPGTLNKKSGSWGVSDTLREKLISATRGALEEMIAMRENEGDVLGDDIKGRVQRISDLLADIEPQMAQMVEGYRDRLRERIAQLLNGSGATVDETALAREVAVFAQRSDISEEITRMRSHVQQVRDILSNGGSMGRKLEFIIQEMSREANTMASKASDPGVMRSVVEIRAEVDRMREQVLNIE
ncbi:MAG: YicC family protein [Planctomycetes bacterium]|nr:YicC family protein [Planctomycetota bacterium]